MKVIDLKQTNQQTYGVTEKVYSLINIEKWTVLYDVINFNSLTETQVICLWKLTVFWIEKKVHSTKLPSNQPTGQLNKHPTDGLEGA